MTHWKPLAWLPNTAGFKFRALLRSGEIVPCVVRRGPDGLHFIEGAPFADVTGWRE